MHCSKKFSIRSTIRSFAYIVVFASVFVFFACQNETDRSVSDNKQTNDSSSSSENKSLTENTLPTTDKSLTENSGMMKLDDIKGWVLTEGIWTDPVIPVCWESMPANFERERAWVQDSVENSWDANSRIDFTGWGQCARHTPNARGIRIAVVDSGAATWTLGSGVSGRKNGLKLNFRYLSWNAFCRADENQRESCVRANAVHEFGHALSFAHEHNRVHDRPETCREIPQGTDGDRILTPWDPDSVMNYCNEGRMDERGVLSAGDISSVQQVYGVDPLPNS